MSTGPTDQQHEAEVEATIAASAPTEGSLASYMQEQRQRVEADQSVKIPLPRFPALEVELRPVDYKREFAIGKVNEKRVRDEANRMLYIMTDTIGQATVGFHTGGQPLAGVDNSWNALVVKAYPEAVQLNTREAIIRLLTEDGVGSLYRDYYEWRESRGEDVAGELEAPLGVTR